MALTAVSNALGTLPDVEGTAARVHAAGAYLMVDAVAYAPHALPDVQVWQAGGHAGLQPLQSLRAAPGVLYLSDDPAATQAVLHARGNAYRLGAGHAEP